MVLTLKLCHGVPVALWHVGSAELGIFPFLNGNGVIKPFPEKTVIGLLFIRRGHLEIVQRTDDRFAPGIEQGFFVSAVVNKKLILPVPGAKMGAQQREDPVFGFDLAAKNTAQLRKADKALEQMGFAVEMAHGAGNGVESLVRESAQKARALAQKLYDQAVKAQLPILHAGKKSPLYQLGGGRGDLDELAQHPPGVGRVGQNRSGIE